MNSLGSWPFSARTMPMQISYLPMVVEGGKKKSYQEFLRISSAQLGYLSSAPHVFRRKLWRVDSIPTRLSGSELRWEWKRGSNSENGELSRRSTTSRATASNTACNRR